MTTLAKKDEYVRARVPNELKVQAERILKEVGLNTTDAIRLLLTQVVNRGGFPLELRTPNRTTIEAMNSAAEPKKFSSAQELFTDLEDDTDD
ncbi:type II toxin-antitoxin system RelB/DinJ family antitoxin (plasmid) [Acinetobacter lwoffii]|jgi:DNA-damage-inducible protein J|uniref:type II toxin-antitoxin system RelB/DinJ family antitoxin n=1 Tax=Acinetobacter lwoffii TaxID=28090 RepID=UPI001C5A9735|nr:type II toxin-antitoxin system RelB/DinJ family antitoxin [Acinetobacter lwoffii]QXX88359.1 type II toxin-antitoxin system RelB/DinJ family antitoxin [Acinetobacter lwoffii]